MGNGLYAARRTQGLQHGADTQPWLSDAVMVSLGGARDAAVMRRGVETVKGCYLAEGMQPGAGTK